MLLHWLPDGTIGAVSKVIADIYTHSSTDSKDHPIGNLVSLLNRYRVVERYPYLPACSYCHPYPCANAYEHGGANPLAYFVRYCYAIGYQRGVTLPRRNA